MEIANTLPSSFHWVSKFQKYSDNPVLRPQGHSYAADAIFNPAAIVHNGKIGLLCRCINMNRRAINGNWSVSSFGWAWSSDGLHFELDPEPIREFSIGPDSPYQGGFEDPRLVKIGDEYVLTYTGVHSPKRTPGMIAFSRDLIHWDFGGEVLPGRAIAIVNQKIDGKYWAYWNNNNLELAWSEDLRKWHVSETPAIRPRPDHFDSCLCEAAAAPLVTDDGILLFYNGAMTAEAAREYATSHMAYLHAKQDTCYCTGWALFDRNDPTRLIARSEHPILSPDILFEYLGISNYTVFSQGYVHFHGKHFLYYGCADMRIGVAVADDTLA